MRVQTVSVIFILMAIYFIITVASTVIIEDYFKPRSTFTDLLLGTIITGVAGLAVKIDLPD